ncbi:MAG: type II toxin-antitoxin system RelE/ParE family toxin [Holophaga sp.]|nr:type II toxin-antitoxin system RelE/ParE family toxin [Holophaga sp.]
MNPKPVVPRLQALRDIQVAVDFYHGEGADEAALGFVDALERAFRHLGRFPGSGSHRHALQLGLPDLRSWPVPRHPYLIFFLEQEEHLDVWRILHAQRDIPASLG